MFSTRNSVKAISCHNLTKEAELRELYNRLEIYTKDYYQSLSSKKDLKHLHQKIIDDLARSSAINRKLLEPLGFSAKWPTIGLRSMAMLSTLIGLASLIMPFCFAISIPLAIVTVYAIKKSFEDISKKERGLKIQAALLAGKEYVFIETGVKNPLSLFFAASSQQPQSNISIGGALRFSLDVIGSTIGLYGCFLSLIGAGVMASNPVTLTVGIAIVTFVVMGYGIFFQKYKRQISEAKKDLMLSEHSNKKHERKYASKY